MLIDTSDTDYHISADLNNTSKQWDLTYSTINLQGDYVLNRAICKLSVLCALFFQWTLNVLFITFFVIVFGIWAVWICSAASENNSKSWG